MIALCKGGSRLSVIFCFIKNPTFNHLQQFQSSPHFLTAPLQVNTDKFILLHHLHFLPHDGNSVRPISLKTYNHLLCFIQVQDEMFVSTPQSGPPAPCTQRLVHL
ncbi:hypothetical protein AMECASPLE_033705 [Ameca splendens]|uniref:Uncharacterized protein n=1 Tax=Ameca splendens TaxID=208324 RepID=A0ABV0ZS63_9TELE